YLSGKRLQQVVQPREVIGGLLQNIFRIRNVLDAVILLVGLGMVLAIILVFALSLRLRQQEIRTIFKLGCRRMTTARLISAEILAIVVISGALCSVLLVSVDYYSSDLVRAFFIR
ncbi:MAG: hypothetical protein ACYSWO_22690, partial [Planctomycetota bacterium]